MESPNLFSSSAKTLAGSPGHTWAVASTRRVSLKSVSPSESFFFFFFFFFGWYGRSSEPNYRTISFCWREGNEQEVAKKRTRRVVKHQRAVVGASLDVIKERRSIRPEARLAARQQALKEGKEKKAAAESQKKAEKAKTAASGGKGVPRAQGKPVSKSSGKR